MFTKIRLYTTLGAFLTISTLLSAEQPGIQTQEVQSEIDIKKLSEAFGHFIGKNLKNSGLNFDIAALVQGIQNGSEGKPSPMSDKEYEKGMLQLQEKAIKKLTDDNLKAANIFLEENKAKPDVVVLEPGKLQYKIVSKGTGEEVKEHGTPLIKYKGSYIDGTVFGNSDDAGGSITLPLDQTIPGFAKALVGMKEGEKRQIFVHPELGYGTTGHLPPNSLLIFEVEVLKAEAPKQDPAAAQEATEDEDAMDEDETPPIAELDVKAKQVPAATNAKPRGSSAINQADDFDDDTEDDDADFDDDEEYDDEDEDEDDLTVPNSKK